MRRDTRGEADRDSERAIEEAKRHARRQELRLVELAVVVLDEVDRALADLGEHELGVARELGFRISVGCGRITVARAEVALPVDERVAHRERLRHVHHGLVGRRIAVRVVLAEHLADESRALGEALRPGVAHRVEDPALHRLEAVGDLGQRARLDGGHRVAEVRLRSVQLDRRGIVAGVA